MTTEETALSDLLRNPQRVTRENKTIGLEALDFPPGVTREAFRFIQDRLSEGKTIDPAHIYRESPALLMQFDGAISGLALFCLWATNTEADGKFRSAATELKHRFLSAQGKGSISKLISR